MSLTKKWMICTLLVAVFAPARLCLADDLNQVLGRLDASAKGFRSTTANFEFDAIQTDPIPDTDVMSGITYYERNGSRFQWAAHVDTHNKKPSAKTYVLSGGVLKVSDTGSASNVSTYPQASKYETYFMLGFGASGTELASKWDIKYLGPEKLDGINTDKLELVAKDPSVRKNVVKVTIWMDTARAVSVKLIFDEGEGQSRVCHYTNIKVNQSVPGNAFSFAK